MQPLRWFFLVTALSFPAAAQQVPARDALVASLSGFESQPDEATVRAWSEGVVPALASIIHDDEVMVAARARAAYALRVFSTNTAAMTLLRSLAGDSSANLFVRLAAINAIVDGGAALNPVTAQLAASDIDVRTGAAAALARARDHGAARAALTARMRVETDANVRHRLEDSLRRISPAGR